MVSIHSNLTPVNQNQVQQDMDALAAAEKSGNQQAILADEAKLENDVQSISDPDQKNKAEAWLQTLENALSIPNFPPDQLKNIEQNLKDCFNP